MLGHGHVLPRGHPLFRVPSHSPRGTAVGMLSSRMSFSLMLSRYFTRARKLLPCAAISTCTMEVRERSAHRECYQSASQQPTQSVDASYASFNQRWRSPSCPP